MENYNQAESIGTIWPGLQIQKGELKFQYLPFFLYLENYNNLVFYFNML